MLSPYDVKTIRAVQSRWSDLAAGCVRNSAALSAWSRCSDDLLLQHVETAKVHSVLDLACGCGDPTLRLAELSREARIVGVDCVEAQTTELARRARAAGLTTVEARAADMFELPFAPGEFDLITCRFGLLRFAENLKRRVFEQAYRLLTPGGRMILVDWGPEGHGSIHGFYQRALLDYASPTELNPDPPKESVSDGLAFARLMQACGFELIHQEYPHVSWCWHDTPAALWSMIADVVPAVRALRERLRPEQLRSLDRRIEYLLSDYRSDGHIALPARNVVVTGVKRLPIDKSGAATT